MPHISFVRLSHMCPPSIQRSFSLFLCKGVTNSPSSICSGFFLRVCVMRKKLRLVPAKVIDFEAHHHKQMDISIRCQTKMTAPISSHIRALLWGLSRFLRFLGFRSSATTPGEKHMIRRSKYQGLKSAEASIALEVRHDGIFGLDARLQLCHQLFLGFLRAYAYTHSTVVCKLKSF
jgi:hypothetical protein